MRGNFLGSSSSRVACLALNLCTTFCTRQNSIICHCYNGPSEAIFLFGQVRNILIMRNWSAPRVCSRWKRVSLHKANRSHIQNYPLAIAAHVVYLFRRPGHFAWRDSFLFFCADTVQRVSLLTKLIPWNNTSLWPPLFAISLFAVLQSAGVFSKLPPYIMHEHRRVKKRSKCTGSGMNSSMKKLLMSLNISTSVSWESREGLLFKVWKINGPLGLWKLATMQIVWKKLALVYFWEAEHI